MTDAEQQEVIVLNVGGVRYGTSRAVLTSVPDSFFGRMFGRCSNMLQAEQDGSFSIHRECERFDLILNYLRDPDHSSARMRNSIRALDEQSRNSLSDDLEYFGIEVQDEWFTNTIFREGPDMGQTRNYCASVLHEGSVYVFGGYNNDATPLASTEILNVDTMEFRSGPEMIQGAREGAAAIALNDNQILVIGGYSGHCRWYKTTEVLNISSMTFTAGPTLQSERNLCATIALGTKRLLVAGGRGRSGGLNTTEVLDYDIMQFTPGPDMACPREGCAGITLDDGRILIAGGNTGNRKTTEILDLDTMTFTSGPDMLAERCGELVAVAVEGTGQRRFLFVGGNDENGDGIALTEVLDPKEMVFEPGPEMTTRRSMCAAAALDGERVIVLGGTCTYEYGALYTSEILRTVTRAEAEAEANNRELPHAMEVFYDYHHRQHESSL